MMACTLDRDHTDGQPVKIQFYDDAVTYWLVPDQKEPPWSKIDGLLTQHMRASDYKPTTTNFLPSEGQMVAVMDKDTKLWSRGKVKTIFVNEHDRIYSVFLVDHGDDTKVPQPLLRELPKDDIFQKEHHATQFKLYGVVPCKKQVACLPDFKLVSVAGKDWDPMASTHVANKSKAATAIYISPMKGIDLCDGEVIQGDLHFVIGGRCISIIDDLCSNQYAIFDELLFNTKSGTRQEEKPMPQTAYKQMESENLPAACSEGLIATTPCTSYGQGRPTITNASMNTPVRSSWVSPIKEPVCIPGGMNVNVLSQKSRRLTQSPNTRHGNKSSHGTNKSNTSRSSTASALAPNTSPLATYNITTHQNASFSPSSTAFESVSNMTEERPTQGVAGKVSGSTFPGSNETESSWAINISPKTTRDVPEQLPNVAVNPVTPDSSQQCVTARGRRFQALLKSRATTKQKDDANESLEEPSINSSLDSSNMSCTGSSPSGLFSQIKTAFDKSRAESDDSNCGFTPVNSPRCVNDKSSSNTPSANEVQNKFLSLLDDLV